MTNYMLANLTKTSHIGEPDAVKVASPVRRGAVGKVSEMITRWLPTLHLYALPATWVDYDTQARQFTAQAKARLEGVLVQHYQRTTTQPPTVEEEAQPTEDAAANEQLVQLWQRFDELGNELYGNRWGEVSRHNAARLTEGATDNPEKLTAVQLQTLIAGMEQLKRKPARKSKRTAKGAG